MFPNLTRRDKVFAADNCMVKTRYGICNGFVDENGVKTCLGIPYAQPPVKNLRWQAPQLLKPYDKTFDAKKFDFSAMKTIDENETAYTNPQSEDCLTLNIWSGLICLIVGAALDKMANTVGFSKIDEKCLSYFEKVKDNPLVFWEQFT